MKGFPEKRDARCPHLECEPGEGFCPLDLLKDGEPLEDAGWWLVICASYQWERKVEQLKGQLQGMYRGISPPELGPPKLLAQWNFGNHWSTLFDWLITVDGEQHTVASVETAFPEIPPVGIYGWFVGLASLGVLISSSGTLTSVDGTVRWLVHPFAVAHMARGDELVWPLT